MIYHQKMEFQILAKKKIRRKKIEEEEFSMPYVINFLVEMNGQRTIQNIYDIYG